MAKSMPYRIAADGTADQMAPPFVAKSFEVINASKTYALTLTGDSGDVIQVPAESVLALPVLYSRQFTAQLAGNDSAAKPWLQVIFYDYPRPVFFGAVSSGGGGGGNVTIVNPLDGGDVAVKVENFPATQPVSGTVAVSNFPATQPVSGTVAVSNFPATQPVSGTVAATQGTSPWTVSLPSETAGRFSAQNGSIKASAATLYGYAIYNSNAAARYLQLLNATAGSATGTGLVTVPLPAGAGANIKMGQLPFGTGLSYCVTQDFAGTSAGAANDIVGTVYYA